MNTDIVPAEPQISAWIDEVFRHGIRRPGYAADRWAEQWTQDHFTRLGLVNVRTEPVETPYWEPRSSSLTLIDDDPARNVEIPCFALPFSSPTAGVEGELCAFDESAPDRVRGQIALNDVRLGHLPHRSMAQLATWAYDPDGTFSDGAHLLPFGRGAQDVMEPSMEAGARAFIGALTNYPGDSFEYYVPYDGKHRPIPGIWISGSDGARVRALLEERSLRVSIRVDAARESITTFNIVGELAGADDDTVIVGSHHDGPWASAVEDASGIALVLAQATYWSQVPQAQRPHRMVFLLNAGHMAGGAGQAAFVRTHRDELDRCVLEVHLEHAASEFVEKDGVLHATGEPEVRWWFTSRLPRLDDAVRGAIETEDLRRSYIVPPTIFGEKPTTDGADFHLAGVPLVQLLAAPFYLFDAMDTLDKVHRPSLVPITRATIRIIESTANVSAQAMREG